MNPFQNKNPSPDFSSSSFQKEFVHDTESSKALIQKELDVNRSEQVLLTQRITLMKGFLNDLPSSDPQYSMLLASIEMDQIEIQELKIRAAELSLRVSQ